MSLPTVGDTLPRVVPTGSGELTRVEADDIYVSQAAVHLLQAQRATLAFGDTTAKTLFTLPAGARVVGFVVNVTVEFNGTTSNVIDIGDGVTANRFVNDLACGAGATGINLVASADEAALSAATSIRGVYVPGGGTPSAGAATITCLYIV